MVRSEEIVKQALTFRKRGLTYTEIATFCGVHESTVARRCKGNRFSKQVTKDNAAREVKDNAMRVSLMQKACQADWIGNRFELGTIETQNEPCGSCCLISSVASS